MMPSMRRMHVIPDMARVETHVRSGAYAQPDSAQFHVSFCMTYTERIRRHPVKLMDRQGNQIEFQFAVTQLLCKAQIIDNHARLIP